MRGITIRKQREATFCALIIKDTSQRIALMEGAKYKNEKWKWKWKMALFFFHMANATCDILSCFRGRAVDTFWGRGRHNYTEVGRADPESRKFTLCHVRPGESVTARRSSWKCRLSCVLSPMCCVLCPVSCPTSSSSWPTGRQDTHSHGTAIDTYRVGGAFNSHFISSARGCARNCCFKVLAKGHGCSQFALALHGGRVRGE